MLRRLFGPVAFLSLIACVPGILLLLGSFVLEVATSTARIETNPSNPPPPGQIIQRYRAVIIVSGRVLMVKTRRPTGVRIQWGWTMRVYPSEGTRWPIGFLGLWHDGFGTNASIIVIPLWPIAAITAVPPIWWLIDRRRRRRRGFVPVTDTLPLQSRETSN